MILVSIECDSGIVRRYDTTLPEGLTHTGLLVPGPNIEAIVEVFRNEPDGFTFRGIPAAWDGAA